MYIYENEEQYIIQRVLTLERQEQQTDAELAKYLEQRDGEWSGLERTLPEVHRAMIYNLYAHLSFEPSYLSFCMWVCTQISADQ